MADYQTLSALKPRTLELTRNLKTVAVNIGQNAHPSWYLPSVPLCCSATGYRQMPTWKDRGRVEYLASRRSAAVRKAIQAYPDAEHIIMVDSYYLNQPQAIVGLIKEYEDNTEEIVLGASTWRLHTRPPPLTSFWDTWTTPECNKLSIEQVGWKQVGGVGGILIAPRRAWENAGWGVPEPFPDSGSEMNYFCSQTRLPVYVSLNIKAIHPEPQPYSLLKRSRIRLHLGRFIPHIRR